MRPCRQQKKMFREQGLGEHIVMRIFRGVGQGWIVADGINSQTGQQDVYLLEPVPLPSGLLLLCCGCALLLTLRYRRSRSFN